MVHCRDHISPKGHCRGFDCVTMEIKGASLDGGWQVEVEQRVSTEY